jgi:hypothetical protein
MQMIAPAAHGGLQSRSRLNQKEIAASLDLQAIKLNRDARLEHKSQVLVGVEPSPTLIKAVRVITYRKKERSLAAAIGWLRFETCIMHMAAQTQLKVPVVAASVARYFHSKELLADVLATVLRQTQWPLRSPAQTNIDRDQAKELCKVISQSLLALAQKQS